MNNKTVYVLGAGFSVEAQIPSQEKLVEKIFELHENAPHLFDPLAMERFIHFLKDILYIPESDFSKVPLEDIFTPIDRCIMDNISFRELDVKEVIEIRNTVYYLIAKALDTLTTNQHQQYIRTFADHLVQKAKHRANNYKEVDPVCVISMNWDVLLDNEINRSLKDTPLESEGVVDYCCHMTAFAENDRATKPGLEVLSTGGFTVKLLKLHGSLNWLHCSRCLRLYVCLDKKIGLHHYDDQQACRHCEKNFPESGRASLLTSNLVMPTFLKNLSSPNLKLIWQNAGIELSEASKIVFIGYSLPQADFEMRQLLSRMVRRDAEIEVVNYSPEGSNVSKNIQKRYDTFFGSRPVNYSFHGAKHYVLNDL